MPMTPTLMKDAIVTSLGVSGITVEDEAALLAISKAIVEYIQANATVTVAIGLDDGGLQTSTTAGSLTAAPLVATSLSGSIS